MLSSYPLNSLILGLSNRFGAAAGNRSVAASGHVESHDAGRRGDKPAASAGHRQIIVKDGSAILSTYKHCRIQAMPHRVKPKYALQASNQDHHPTWQLEQ
tara:strand:+ start:1331 stop:1630 length:300 start_codon:yes stop_codon:yes gene_type:complete